MSFRSIEAGILQSGEGGRIGPSQGDQPDIEVATEVPSKYPQSQPAVVRYFVLRALESGGANELVMFLKSEYVLVGLGCTMLRWQRQQWSRLLGPFSNLDLWVKLIELMHRLHKPMMLVQIWAIVQSLNIHAHKD